MKKTSHKAKIAQQKRNARARKHQQRRKKNKKNTRRIPQPAKKRVNLPAFQEFLKNVGFDRLCQEVYQRQRTTQRNRKWSFRHLALAWILIALLKPESLTRFLDACARGVYRHWLYVKATPEAFFQKNASLPWPFMSDLVNAFLTAARQYARPTRIKDRTLRRIFKSYEVYTIDGSRLDALKKLPKPLRGLAEVILGGQITMAYNMRYGLLWLFSFALDAKRSELTSARDLLKKLPKNALLVVDRLFATPKFAADVLQHGAHLLSRRWESVKFHNERPLGKTRYIKGCKVTESLVEVGPEGNRQTWRHIVCKSRMGVLELITTILDPKDLSAWEAIQLYKQRWTIERVFYEMKITLNLQRIYASSPCTVAHQVYATVIAHTALRLIQAKVADELRVAPEAVSFQKLKYFVEELAVFTGAYYRIRHLYYLNGGRFPELDEFLPPIDSLSLLVEPRKSCDNKRSRKKDKSSRRWISLKDIPALAFVFEME